MKFKKGDKVKFINKDSENAKYFEQGLTDLEINKVNFEEYDYSIYESDKSYSWGVNEDELELQLRTLDEVYKNRVGTFMWAVEQQKGTKLHWKYDNINTFGDQYMKIVNGDLQFFNKEDNSRGSDFITKVMINANWEIYEDNKFGDFEVTDAHEIIMHTSEGERNVTLTGWEGELDDLEKAIKRARELQ